MASYKRSKRVVTSSQNSRRQGTQDVALHINAYQDSGRGSVKLDTCEIASMGNLYVTPANRQVLQT